MATTGTQIRDRAIERSSLNNSGLLPTAQILNYITQAERKAYVRAARINPDYFGTVGASSTRAAYTDTWNLASTPGSIAAVTLVEVNAITGTVSGVAVGDKVNLIRKTRPELEIAPRAYLRGKVVTGYGTELGAATANMVTSLKVYYSPIPAAMTSLTQSVVIDDEWTDLLVLPLAKSFAMRDGRDQEAQLIQQEYDDTWADFAAGVMVYDHGVKRSLVSVPAIPMPQQAQG